MTDMKALKNKPGYFEPTCPLSEAVNVTVFDPAVNWKLEDLFI